MMYLQPIACIFVALFYLAHKLVDLYPNKAVRIINFLLLYFHIFIDNNNNISNCTYPYSYNLKGIEINPFKYMKITLNRKADLTLI